MQWRTKRRAIALAVVIAVIDAVDVQAAVYRCVGPGERIHFHQFGCPLHSVHTPVDLAAGNFISAAPLTDLERDQLKRLESRLEAARMTSRNLRERRNAAAQRERRESERLCVRAQTHLEKLAARRRGGYAASEDRALSREEVRWQQEEKARC